MIHCYELYSDKTKEVFDSSFTIFVNILGLTLEILFFRKLEAV